MTQWLIAPVLLRCTFMLTVLATNAMVKRLRDQLSFSTAKKNFVINSSAHACIEEDEDNGYLQAFSSSIYAEMFESSTISANHDISTVYSLISTDAIYCDPSSSMETSYSIEFHAMLIRANEQSVILRKYLPLRNKFSSAEVLPVILGYLSREKHHQQRE